MNTLFSKAGLVSKPLSNRCLRATAVGVIAAACVFIGPRFAHAADTPDTVFLSDGGRVRGTVMVEDNKEVRVQLADGTTKTIPKGTVQRVQYGAASAPAATTPAATAATPTPAPVPPIAQNPGTAQPAASDDDAPSPPRRRHPHYAANDDDYAPPPPQHMHMRSPGLVAGGAIMVTFGLCAMIAGAIGTAALASSNNSDGIPPLLVATEGGGSLLLIPGAVMIAVGRHRVPATEDTTPTPEAMVFQPKVNGFQLSF